MPVNTEHDEYKAAKPEWAQLRAVAAGQRAVHALREVLLPRLSDEDDADYEARLRRSSFFNAMGRTIEGLKGMVMRVDPKVETSSAVEQMLEDVTKTGVSLPTFCGQVLTEALTVGRVGILTDYPEPVITDRPLTVAEVEALNLRPHLALYKAESIVNWSTGWINNKTMLSMVVLLEAHRVPGVDEFEVKTEPQYRVLDLAPLQLASGGEVMAYRVRIFRKPKEGAAFQLVGPPQFPLMNGAPLLEIPFQFVSGEDTTPAVEKAPLADLADVNLSHYRSTSDRKHGAHLTALPQPWANKISPSFGPDGNPLKREWKIGGTDLWTFPNDSQVGMLEYTGQGLGTLREEIEREEKQMAVLGARMLEQQQRQVETAEAAGIHRTGEQSTLQALAGLVSRALSAALSVFDEWGGGNGEATVELNKDYMPSALSSQELTALVQAWQNGALSPQELFFNLQQGGIIPEKKTYEEHQTEIDNAPPALSSGLPTAGGDVPPGGSEAE